MERGMNMTAARTWSEWVALQGKAAGGDGVQREEERLQRRRAREARWDSGAHGVPSAPSTVAETVRREATPQQQQHPHPPAPARPQRPKAHAPRSATSASGGVGARLRAHSAQPAAQVDRAGGGGGGSSGDAHHAASGAAAAGGEEGETWKSVALYHEVKLRGLLADDHRLPDRLRLNKVLQHYRAITDAFPLFRTVFDLVLSELNLSLYATAVTTAGALERVPYFEILTSLKRETEQLKAELHDARTEDNQDTLLYELQAARSRNRYLTHQVDKLNQENETLLEDVAKLNRETDTLSKNGRQAFHDLECQNRKAMAEIRRLTSENTVMTYDSRSRLGNLAEYASLKQRETGDVKRMLHCRYEFTAYVQLMCQLELSENFLLNEYDIEMRTTSAAEMPMLRSKLVQRLRVIRAELHTLESYHSCLLLHDPRDPRRVRDQPRLADAAPAAAAAAATTGNTPGIPGTHPLSFSDADADAAGPNAAAASAAAAADRDVSYFNPLNNADNLNDLRGRVRASAGGASSDAQPSSPLLRKAAAATTPSSGRRTGVLWEEEPAGGREVGVSFEETLAVFTGCSKQGRDSFVANMLRSAPSVAAEILWASVDQLGKDVAAARPEDALNANYLVPLLENDPKKLDYAIDVVAHTAGASQEHVKTVTAVDPCSVIELPPKTATLSLKFSKAAGSQPTPYKHELSNHQKNGLQEEQQKDMLQKRLVGLYGAPPKKGKDGAAVDTLRAPSGVGPVWRLYAEKAGDYTPRSPRLLGVELIEHVVFETLARKRAAVLSLYLGITGTSTSKEHKDKQFAAGLRPTDLIDSLFLVLEQRYHLPPVVNKAAFELLAACEHRNTPLMSLFVASFAGGSEAEVTASILSTALHMLEDAWPLSVLQPEATLSQKELQVLLERLYPAFTVGKVDALLSDVAIFTRANFSLTDMRAYFVDRVCAGKEHHMADATKAVAFKANTLKWKELDKFDFADACCSSINYTSEVSIDAIKEHLKFRHQESCIRNGSGRTRLGLKELSLMAAETTWLSVLDSPGGYLKPEQK